MYSRARGRNKKRHVDERMSRASVSRLDFFLSYSVSSSCSSTFLLSGTIDVLGGIILKCKVQAHAFLVSRSSSADISSFVQEENKSSKLVNKSERLVINESVGRWDERATEGKTQAHTVEEDKWRRRRRRVRVRRGRRNEIERPYWIGAGA